MSTPKDIAQARAAQRAQLEETLTEDLTPAQLGSQDDVDALRRQEQGLLAGLPESEHADARASMYLDADGTLRTRHRSLRAL